MEIFDKIEDALIAFKKGEFIIVVDDENRENEGDLIGVAEIITPEKINFMIQKGGGLICVSMEKKRLQELALPQMVTNNNEKKAFLLLSELILLEC
jgi:3,4-dihydroxy 2-butanone 4-phosphate synthase/GTP cyclohydrolase II